MSKEKQMIEEMAKDLCQNTFCSLEEWNKCKLKVGEYCANCRCMAERLYNAGYRKMPDNIGEFSDGYHTFNELYHHRAVLFSVICNMFPEKAWKSKLHDTGDMYNGMFIVGIETEQGQATYHYDIEPYWDMFKVKELEKAPKYDGHTPSNAIARIGGIGHRKQSEGEWRGGLRNYECSVCNGYSEYWTNYCPNCRAKMKGGAEQCKLFTMSYPSLWK